MPTDLSGRSALVTGAARGIGLAVAADLAANGARVALVDADGPALTASAGELAGRTGAANVLPVLADVTSASEVQGAVAAAVSAFGGLDILVNNAGICPLTPFEAIDEAEWDRVLAVNLKGAFLFCQAALPALRRSRSGRIVNVSSVSGQMGGVLVGAHYAASKAGLIALTKSLARLVAGDGITVNCVTPATTATDLTAAWSPELQDRVRAQIPLGRFAGAGEIAAAVCFLAGDGASFITGATLDVNGGLLMR